MQQINLSVGYADVSNLHHLNAAGWSVIDEEQLRFPTSFAGVPTFREAIAAKLQLKNEISDITSQNILVTVGVTQALHLLVSSLLSPNDEVLLPMPAWDYFPALLRHKKLQVRTFYTSYAHHFLPTAADLKAQLTTNTKMLFLTHPGNPGGGVYTRQQLAEIVEVLQEFPQLIIVSDEIYELINWTDVPLISLASFSAIRERVITVNGFSKSFGLTSWRVGYLAAPLRFMPQLVEQQKLNTYGCPVASQLVAWQAIQKEVLYEDLWRYLIRENRDKMYQFFAGVEGVRLQNPQGTFFVFPDFSEWAKQHNMKHPSELNALFERVGILVNNGNNFGLPWYLRINFAQSPGKMQEILNRMNTIFTNTPS